jgi:hypothetical protein
VTPDHGTYGGVMSLDNQSISQPISQSSNPSTIQFNSLKNNLDTKLSSENNLSEARDKSHKRHVLALSVADNCRGRVTNKVNSIVHLSQYAITSKLNQTQLIIFVVMHYFLLHGRRENKDTLRAHLPKR